MAPVQRNSLLHPVFYFSRYFVKSCERVVLLNNAACYYFIKYKHIIMLCSRGHSNIVSHKSTFNNVLQPHHQRLKCGVFSVRTPIRFKLDYDQC